MTVSSVDEELHFSPIDEDEINFIITDDKALTDFTKSYQSRHTDHSVFQFISRISAPIFLGLERAHRRTVDWTGDSYSAHLPSARRWNRSVSRGRRIFEGALTAGLAETQSIVEEAYRRIRISESRRSEQLRESILVSAFRYQELTTWPFSSRDGLTAREEWERIQQRRAEIENALENIGVSKKKLSAEVGQFFQNLDDLFSSISASKDDGSYPIEWLMNKAQIDRVSELIEIIDENRVKVARLYSPINKFLQTLNSFYADGGKTLEVNEVGQLQFKRGNGMTVPIAALSSGERQLLIIFSHLAFNRYGDR